MSVLGPFQRGSLLLWVTNKSILLHLVVLLTTFESSIVMLTPANGNSHKPHQQSQATSMSVPATTHDRELGRTLAVQVASHYSTSRFGAAHASLQNEKNTKSTALALLKRGSFNSSPDISSPLRFLQAPACAFASVCFCTSPWRCFPVLWLLVHFKSS